MSKLFTFLLEASKIDVLVKKVGLSEETANKLYKIFKNRSVFIVIKNIEKVKNLSSYDKNDPKYTNEYMVDLFISSPYGRGATLNYVDDYMVVGLNGVISSLKDKTIEEIIKLSKEWHDSLGVGEGKIDEIEKLTVNYNDHYSPTPDKKYFNEYLKEELENFDAETYPND